jgi:hypothetical protein
MTSTKLFATFLATVTLSAAAPAFANPSGIQQNLGFTNIHTEWLWLDANVQYEITTTNLVPAVPGGTADTVLHLQKYDTNGTFLAGNDDYFGLGSRVLVTPPTSQWAHVVVHAYNEWRNGSATLTVRRAGVVYSTSTIEFAGRTITVPLGGLATNTDVWTQEHFDGPNDAVVLVLSGSAGNAIAYDDDDGLDWHSRVRIGETCSSCFIVYGHRNLATENGPGTVAWDGDVASLDSDNDLLGNSFESVLGTSPYDRDSDDDGIDDPSEVFGIEYFYPTPSVKLPLWGANPTVKDLFVELDWQMCPAGDCPGDPDAWRLPPAAADQIVAHFAPDIRVHLDTGRENTAATTTAEWTKWGNWYGAERQPFVSRCGTLTAERFGVFHHFHITAGPGGGGAGENPGRCALGARDERTITHELGHNLGLYHGGNVGSASAMNNKPNYPSIINYGFTYDPSVSFSRNTTSVVLNPTTMNEQSSGLSPALLATLGGGGWQFMTDPGTGKIDWNRDGIYDSNVRGAPTWSIMSSPEATAAYHVQDLEAGIAPALARMASPGRFYLFSRRTSDGLLQYRYTTSFASCTGGEGWGDCVSWVGPTVIANSLGGSTAAPAVHRVVSGGVEKLMVVYSGASGNLYYQLGTSADVWTAPTYIDTTTWATNAEPELVPSGAGGNLRIYYEKFGVLYRREYDAVSNTWGAAVWEKTTTNASIAMSFGISITSGYEDGLLGPAGPYWYAALANPYNANRIELWRYNSTTDNWSQHAYVWSTTQVATTAAPSLAYVPFSSANSTLGQFYLLYKDTGDGMMRMMKTEGNSTASIFTRRLQWRQQSIPAYNEWSYTDGSGDLLYEMGVDTNLRSTWKLTGRQIWFHPVMDGIPSLLLKDQNDYYFMTEMLDCSLGAGGCIPL